MGTVVEAAVVGAQFVATGAALWATTAVVGVVEVADATLDEGGAVTMTCWGCCPEVVEQGT